MITVNWLNPEQTIILWQNDGAMTTQEYAVALEQSAGLARSVDYPVGVILDMRRAGGIPKNSFSLTRSVIQDQPANMVITVVISNSTFWEKIWGMMARFYASSHINIQFTTSIDEAHRLIDVYLQPQRQ
jgi:hypothetical protein